MRFKNKQGFTLIEILLVCAIIVVLAAMVLPKFAGRGKEAKLSAAHGDIEGNITTALDLYELDNGRYPTTEQGLRALLEAPTTAPVPKNWNGPYLKKKKIPLDPWSHEYVYAAPGVHNKDDFDLSSYGPDGVASDDDVTNWGEITSADK